MSAGHWNLKLRTLNGASAAARGRALKLLSGSAGPGTPPAAAWPRSHQKRRIQRCNLKSAADALAHDLSLLLFDTASFPSSRFLP